MRIHLQFPGGPVGKSSEVVDLESGEAVLVGRDPSEEALRERFPSVPGAIDGRTVRSLRTQAPSVSGNHALFWIEDGAVRFQDLKSKNGTWLRLPRDRPVAVRSDDAVVVGLAMAAPLRERDHEPPDVRWHGPDDFGEAMLRVLREFLDASGVRAEVYLARPSPGDPGPRARLALADGLELRVLPLETADLRFAHTIDRAARWVARHNALYRADEASRGEQLILESEAIKQAHREVVDAAHRGLPLLLIGPTGSGKEGLAQCYHRESGGSGKLVALNCGSYGTEKEFLRAELFGAEKGSFTGCVSRIVGAAEQADHGTLFLDEIGEMPAEVQPLLLRFLDSGQFHRLGNVDEVLTSRARVVCATNKDLRAATLRGEFREDVWYRFAAIVEVPPLSRRFADVCAFLKREHIAPGLCAYDMLTAGALDVIRAHPFRGNFRELSNFVLRLPREPQARIDATTCRELLRRGALLTADAGPPLGGDGEPLSREHWGALALQAFDAYAARSHPSAPPESGPQLASFLDQFYKPLLVAHLGGVAGAGSAARAHVARVGRKLGVDRKTAKAQIERYLEIYVR